MRGWTAARRRAIDWQRVRSWLLSRWRKSQIAGGAQAFEGIFRFMVHGTAGSFRNLGSLELDEDLVDRAGMRGDRRRDVGAPERAVALAVACEIKRDNGNAFAPEVGPNIAF